MGIVRIITFASKHLMAKVFVLSTPTIPAVLMATVLPDGSVSTGHVPKVAPDNLARTMATAKRDMSVAITGVYIVPVGNDNIQFHFETQPKQSQEFAIP